MTCSAIQTRTLKVTSPTLKPLDHLHLTPPYVVSCRHVNDDSLLSIIFYVSEIILELDVETDSDRSDGLYKNCNISKEQATVGGAKWSSVVVFEVIVVKWEMWCLLGINIV